MDFSRLGLAHEGASALTRLEPQSRFGDKTLGLDWIVPITGLQY